MFLPREDGSEQLIKLMLMLGLLDHYSRLY